MRVNLLKFIIFLGGAGHVEELRYLFRREKPDYKVNPQDALMRERLVKLWSNFVKFR